MAIQSGQLKKAEEYNMPTFNGKLAVQLQLFSVCLCTALVSVVCADESIGRVLTDSEIDKLNSHVFPDGQGLPSGQGTVAEGETLYRENCSSCHGSAGEGANSVELIGDRELLATEYPDKGIAVVWPFAPTLFEYISRAMPPDRPGSFSPDELYSVTGYVLHLNDLLPANATINKSVLSSIDMPNRDGFTDLYSTE